jgi:hypothetical protein
MDPNSMVLSVRCLVGISHGAPSLHEHLHLLDARLRSLLCRQLRDGKRDFPRLLAKDLENAGIGFPSQEFKML